MANFLCGISVWAAYGVISAASVLLCSRMSREEEQSRDEKTEQSC